ncbi:MAG TPA: hypothetical protein VFS10_04440 [Pyrinomonadaceae bacterium]|nr:hypothetical protein [Pyrinomonadaceae bacterium]
MTTEKEFRRGFSKSLKPPAEQIIQMPERRPMLPFKKFKVQGSKFKVKDKAPVLDFEL